MKLKQLAMYWPKVVVSHNKVANCMLVMDCGITCVLGPGMLGLACKVIIYRKKWNYSKMI